MKLSTPRWWYRRNAPGAVTRLLLTPLGWIWAAATARRIARAAPVDPGVPVICVGNLTMGGAGKTPVARAVAQRLLALGLRPAVLSRGHGGRLPGPLRVDPAVHTAADVGDEPLMLALGGLEVWIGADRVASARAAAAAGAQVLVMDDGHQNPSLRKALSLVVVDAETRDGEWPFGPGAHGRGAVFPSGPLREPLRAGLARADAVVALQPPGLAALDPDLRALFGALPVLEAAVAPVAPPPAGPLVAFAGVAKPWKVERALRAAGAQLAEFVPYPDHHPFTDSDLAFLTRLAADAGAALLTTEKDHARLPPAWRPRVTPWPITATFADMDALDRLLPKRAPG